MLYPTGQQVAAFLGRGDDATLAALAEQHVQIVGAMARAYTRGRGFDEAGDPYEDVEAVIVTATARLAANPQLTLESSIDDSSIKRSIFNGWTLAETFVLNRYRRRAA